VVFSKSFVNKKTEQQIEEGVYDHFSEPSSTGNTVEFENSMHTEPVSIQVKPVPVINQPADYNGATGDFSITAIVKETTIKKNEEGELLVTITGKGNFTQLSAPSINWPKGIEGFEPLIKDELDKTQSPLTGKRVFRFPFTISQPGAYSLPAVRFSYFNPDSNNYKKVSSRPVSISVTDIAGSESAGHTRIVTPGNKNSWIWWLAGGVFLSTAVFIILRKRSRHTRSPEQVVENETASIASLLQPVRLLLGADNKVFYSALGQGVWKFLDERFELRGSNMSRQALRIAMQQSHIITEHQHALLELLTHCEAGSFTDADSGIDRKELLQEAERTLTSIGLKA
jgi:hypothetical protein